MSDRLPIDWSKLSDNDLANIADGRMTPEDSPRYVPLTRANRPKVEVERADLGSLVVHTSAWGIQYKPSRFARLLRWLRLSKPCSIHGRDKWCTNCDC